jgi:RND family efflux transporter MFP subunit
MVTPLSRACVRFAFAFQFDQGLPMSEAGAVRAMLALVAALPVAACGQDNRYAAPPPPKVDVAPPIEREVTNYFESTGNAAAINTVDLVARVQGFVQAINYNDGDFVKKGTSLFVIEPEPYRLKVESAKASVASNQAALTRAEADFKRQAVLVPEQSTALSVYDQALAQRDTARANLQSAQADEQQAEITLSYTNVAAPFDGIVSARKVSIGELVGAGTSPTVMATIVQRDPIYVNFTASERDVLQVRANLARSGRNVDDLLGIPVEIGLQTETGYPHVGKLDYIAPTVDQSTGTLAARAILPNTDHALLPGYFTRVRVPGRPYQGLLVPDVALGSDQGGRYVLVVNKDNVVEQRHVEPRQLVGELRVIETGLSKDDRVVVGGIMRAIPGQKVEPELAAAAAK